MKKSLALVCSSAMFCWLLAGCLNAKASDMQDAWWRSPENPGLFDKPLSDTSLSEVAPSMQTAAQAMLERAPVKEITQQAAAKFTNGRLKPEKISGLRFYLVRAMRLDTGGKFSAYRHGSAIYISHGDLGQPRPEKRSVVVVGVKGEILDAFATCSTVE